MSDVPPNNKFAKARKILKSAIQHHAFPGAVLGVGHEDQLWILPAGRLSYDEQSAAVTPETIYDLASLTKVVATTTAAMILAERGKLKLDAPVAAYLPDFVQPYDLAVDPLWIAREEVTVRQLLTHSSGLPGYEKFFLRAREKSHVIDEALALPLEDIPGRRTIYSDIGFILLGEVLEQVSKEKLDAFCEREIFVPLQMRDTRFNPPREWSSRIAPTELDQSFRKRLICGEVQDENAWVMGGVAGHAGLFGTAGDLASFCRMMLQEGRTSDDNNARLVRPETIQEFTRAWPVTEGPRRGLGWDKPTQPSSSGRYYSAAAYGHLGYTGTSIWIDPEKSLFVILLTNRVHPSRSNEAIQKVRPEIHDAVVNALA